MCKNPGILFLGVFCFSASNQHISLDYIVFSFFFFFNNLTHFDITSKCIIVFFPPKILRNSSGTAIPLTAASASKKQNKIKTWHFGSL